ncbi:type II toxin-antitoxin system VapC family toxin [Psychroflexus gondwanensis]|uniref:PIN domain-containing protein n=1 Tax=Psychroflexus gondwanensis TaxID=251 RepID=UPI0011BF1BF8|nr:PIN domain-containing protein [Psychroflexus gondwanensis]TXE19476.1 type II toxin-antitoxin system VapC family toxin [Psychroflexus gondwanensis]
MKKQRIYLDTSVFGGYFDKEFKEFTAPLFERIFIGEFTILLSTMIDEELEFAPERIKTLFSKLDDSCTEFLKDTDEAVDLASQYIEEKVVGQTSYADCLHIALATVYQADLLVSWNYKHIVNIERIRGYNSINIKNGYRHLEIRSPRDLTNHKK